MTTTQEIDWTELANRKYTRFEDLRIAVDDLAAAVNVNRTTVIITTRLLWMQQRLGPEASPFFKVCALKRLSDGTIKFTAAELQRVITFIGRLNRALVDAMHKTALQTLGKTAVRLQSDDHELGEEILGIRGLVDEATSLLSEDTDWDFVGSTIVRWGRASWGDKDDDFFHFKGDTDLYTQVCEQVGDDWLSKIGTDFEWDLPSFN
jgi:hypothetical protein